MIPRAQKHRGRKIEQRDPAETFDAKRLSDACCSKDVQPEFGSCPQLYQNIARLPGMWRVRKATSCSISCKTLALPGLPSQVSPTPIVQEFKDARKASNIC